MAQSVIMPKAGMAMETGTVIQWLKNEGDTVKVGEPLLEIETDKVSMEVEAEFAGVLLRILKGPGEVVPVTETIGYIGEPGEQVPEESASAAESSSATVSSDAPASSGVAEGSDAAETAGASGATQAGQAQPGAVQRLESNNGRVAATPAARRVAAEHGLDLSDARASGPAGEVREADVWSLLESSDAGATADSIKASSLARRIARDQGVNLRSVTGSGPHGRIVKEDVLAAASGQEPSAGTAEPGYGVETGAAASAAAAPAPAAAAPVGAEEERRPISGMRKVIADNMLRSHQTIPPVTLNAVADVGRLLDLRVELNRGVDRRLEEKVSVNDLVMKAVARALMHHRALNATVQGNELVLHADANIGMAVALPNGLIVPTLRRVQDQTLGAVARQTKELASKARDGKLKPADLEGATFTVSNLGMFGIVSFNPIINPPQVAILGVCAISDTPSLDDGRLVNRKQMGLSLTIDHRVVDGAQGAQFLQTLVELIEHPAQILL